MSDHSKVRLRPAISAEKKLLSDLCLRSKAVWGYDKAFMDKCKAELTLSADDCASPNLIVAERNETIVGMAEVVVETDGCFLEKLFVDPEVQHGGIGRELFSWSAERASTLGQKEMIIEADPGAVGFYQAMGAVLRGETPSNSIPGRMLPTLVLALNCS